MTNLRAQPAAWPISEKFREILAELVREQAGSCVLSFRDPGYSAENGGYHPVEIMVGSGGDIGYITDFSFVGIHPHTELAKELDFDFSNQVFEQLGFHYDISAGREIFKTWQENFCNYFCWGVFKVSVDPM